MLLIEIELVPLSVSVATFCPPIPPTVTEAQLRLLGDAVAPNANAGIPTQTMHIRAIWRHQRALTSIGFAIWELSEEKKLLDAKELHRGSAIWGNSKDLKINQLTSREELDVQSILTLLGAHGVTRLTRFYIDPETLPRLRLML